MNHVTTADQTQLYVKDWGTGRPVILTHGWPLSSDSWDDQAMALADAGFRVIAYDRRGFGRSSQPWSGYDDNTFADEMTTAMKGDRAKFLAGSFKDFFGVGLVSHPASAELLEWARSVSMQAGPKATLASAKALATTDFRPDLAAFRVPTLIIHSTADKTVPIDASGRAAAKAIKGAELIEYEGAPHGLFATEKERFTRDLLEFVKR